LALGGYCTAGRNGPTDEVNGVEFRHITEGNITFNRGFGGCSFWTTTNLAEILTHELGHTIGIGHSSESVDETSAVLKDATMYFRAHFDGRGATLRSNDVDGARFIYPGSPADPPIDLDADGIDDDRDNCPGSTPGMGIANAAQTDVDGDGRGDLCDPCPLGERCAPILSSRLRVRARGRAGLVWTSVLDDTVDLGEDQSLRIELVSGDGSLLSSAIEARPVRRGKRKSKKRRHRLRLRTANARILLTSGRRGGSKLRVVVRPFELPSTLPPVLSANVIAGGQAFTTALLCRSTEKHALDCRS
jgi:hypothetical protein